jgi:hypothetical protein
MDQNAAARSQPERRLLAPIVEGYQQAPWKAASTEEPSAAPGSQGAAMKKESSGAFGQPESHRLHPASLGSRFHPSFWFLDRRIYGQHLIREGSVVASG